MRIDSQTISGFVIGFVRWDSKKNRVLEILSTKLEKILKWLNDSGLKVNENKTEMCIFHRNEKTEGQLKMEEAIILANM